MSLRGTDNREEEVMQAFARYLEIVERGGDGEAFLRSNATIEADLRALAGLDAHLQVEVPESEFAGRARAFAGFRAAIKEDDPDMVARALAWFRPRLFGILGALGLGMGLSAAFASGALPSGKLNGIFAAIPVFGSTSDDTHPPRDELITPTRIEDAGPVHQQTSPADNLSDLPAAPPPNSESTDARHGPAGPAVSDVNQTAGNATDDPGNSSEHPSPGQIKPESTQAGGNGNGIGPQGTPPGQGGEIPGTAETPNPGDNGVGPDGTPPGQGGDNPGNANGNGSSNAGGNGNGIGPEGTPPGQGGEIPGTAETPNAGDNGNDVGSDGTPPGQGNKTAAETPTLAATVTALATNRIDQGEDNADDGTAKGSGGSIAGANDKGSLLYEEIGRIGNDLRTLGR